jgi:hypothetical protein
LQLSPYLAPLDKDLVKVILRLLKSSTFTATPALLAALASSHHERKTPHGLLKVRAGSKYLLLKMVQAATFLVVQFAVRLSTSLPQMCIFNAHMILSESLNFTVTDPMQAGSSAFLPYIHHLVGQSSPHGPPSGVLGCLSSKDWAVRRAAGDTLRAMTLLIGPLLEPEGHCDVTDPATITGKCLQTLESARFDKVRLQGK